MFMNYTIQSSSDFIMIIDLVFNDKLCKIISINLFTYLILYFMYKQNDMMYHSSRHNLTKRKRF